ncbi:MAG: DUF1326 domain-containing protein [Armatimonadota bacterium]|nr:DUF1326 domain-containing protein [Armatimonadota bacterium]MDR7532035.1 DUF1326 domain-containing protein [Armatimonadota bacterium]MDR7535966.1 DUF1326 domain-containing protein [Armatimonadota bacterium]
MGYELEGALLEACSCAAVCPCWVGQDPDGGACNGLIAYHYDRGQINGVDVAGLTLALVVQIPGNVLKGNWKAVVFVDSRATPQQKEAILAAHTGKLGGPLADLAPLVGEVLGVYDAPIDFSFHEGKGRITIGDAVTSEMEPLTDLQGHPTKLVDSIFSTIPGSAAFVGRAPAFRADVPQHRIRWEYSGRNAVLGPFSFAA